MKKNTILFIALLMCTFQFSFSYAGTSKNQNPPTAGEVIASIVDTIHGDVNGAVSTVYNDTKGAIESLYPDVKSAIVAIGKAIGVAAEHVYSVLVRQYVVEGVKWLLISIIGLLLTILGWITINKHVKNGGKLTYAVLFPAICTLIGVCILLRTDYNAMLMGLINPEWGAINYILEYTQNLVG